MPIAHDSLRHLSDEGLRVTQKQSLQCVVAVKFLLESWARQAIRMSRALHERAVGRRLSTHEQRNADQPIIAHDGNLRG